MLLTVTSRASLSRLVVREPPSGPAQVEAWRGVPVAAALEPQGLLLLPPPPPPPPPLLPPPLPLGHNKWDAQLFERDGDATGIHMMVFHGCNGAVLVVVLVTVVFWERVVSAMVVVVVVVVVVEEWRRLVPHRSPLRQAIVRSDQELCGE
ncbi:hypothetical protein E2C01_034713 [Portunus trituberculatus]|uniref:Uncharacterized protein n=1 Tax=Portunus trituberculatus TaxID=210409 RepID=A0A5B7F7N2_PORTR|nr:hypothetical protein [Portunus trituberculatus]